jgi:high-affinity iron transporter
MGLSFKYAALSVVVAAAPIRVAAQTVALAQTPAQAQTPDAEAARRIVATLQLAAQEYRLAWEGGVLAKPGEWVEAQLFVGEARRSALELAPALRGWVAPRLTALEQRLAGRMPADSLALEAGDIERRLTVVLGVALDERPAREPSLASGARIFRQQCAACHGELGRGDGPAGAVLTPRPANLTAPALLASRTPLDIYRRVTHGTPGTAMPSFGGSLSKEQRWDVVSHVFAFSDTTARRGRSGQVAVVFGTVRGELGGAMALAGQGEREAAARRVLDAYLAYEAVEGSLSASDPAIVKRAEARFTALREAVGARSTGAERDRRHGELLASLAESETALTRTHSAAGLFTESFLLIVREGFEAILVVGAIMAVLIKAGARQRQKNVRWGIGAAIAASLLTAALLEMALRATPAQREALEGGIMLVAAVMLFYVSYWLISKIEVAAWTRFVKEQIERAAESGSALALALVAFLAVYREGFETVLFYKALYVTGAASGAAPITAGLVAGLAVLIAVYVGIEAFGLKIPMRPFFAVTGATLAFMAFVFAGDGVKELQEGGYVPSSLIPGGPRSDFLGVYPTWESLALQAVILAAIFGALVYTFAIGPRRRDASGAAGGGGAPVARRGRRTQPRRTAGV